MFGVHRNGPVGRHQQLPAQKGGNFLSDTIIAIAISVIAFVGASKVQRQSPGLATLMRLIPAGVSLIWLFRRFDGGNGGAQHHVVHHAAPQPRNGGWWPNFFAAAHPHMNPVHQNRNHFPPVAPAPAQQGGFPRAVPAPAQPVHQHNNNQGGGWNLFGAKEPHMNPVRQNRNNFPPVVPAGKNNNDPQMFAVKADRNQPQKFPARGGGFPNVQRAPARGGGFPNVQRAPARGGGFPNVQRPPAQGGGFPNVQKAPAQGGGEPQMFAVRQNR